MGRSAASTVPRPRPPEAAILISAGEMLPMDKIEREMALARERSREDAGPPEREAWKLAGRPASMSFGGAKVTRKN